MDFWKQNSSQVLQVSQVSQVSHDNFSGKNEFVERKIFPKHGNTIVNKGTETNRFSEKNIRPNQENEFMKILTNSNNNLFWIKNKSKYLQDQDFLNEVRGNLEIKNFLNKNKNKNKNTNSNSLSIQKRLSISQMLQSFNPKKINKIDIKKNENSKVINIPKSLHLIKRNSMPILKRNEIKYIPSNSSISSQVRKIPNDLKAINNKNQNFKEDSNRTDFHFHSMNFVKTNNFLKFNLSHEVSIQTSNIPVNKIIESENINQTRKIHQLCKMKNSKIPQRKSYNKNNKREKLIPIIEEKERPAVSCLKMKIYPFNERQFQFDSILNLKKQNEKRPKTVGGINPVINIEYKKFHITLRNTKAKISLKNNKYFSNIGDFFGN